MSFSKSLLRNRQAFFIIFFLIKKSFYLCNEIKKVKTMKNQVVRSISEIAKEIKADWKKVSPHALPYLNAMYSLEKVTDYYVLDSAKSVISYFLANAITWRGEKAKAIKKELNQMIK